MADGVTLDPRYEGRDVPRQRTKRLLQDRHITTQYQDGVKVSFSGERANMKF